MVSFQIEFNTSIPNDNSGGTTSNIFADEDLSTLSTLIPTGIGLYILSLTTFVGNAMVLHAIRTEKRLQTVSNMFIMSLASADLTVGLIVMPISSAYAISGDWKFGYIVCQFWLVIDYTASTASIFNLCILSLDRYWSISTPLQYLRKRTKKRALIMIGLAWLASAMWFIPVLGWHHMLYNGKRQQPEGVCDTEFATNMTFKVVTTILNFYIPVILMIVINVRIFLAIRRRSEDIERLGATTSAFGCGSTNQNPNQNGTSVQEDIACDSLTEHDHMDNEYCRGHKKALLRKKKRKKKRTRHSSSNNSTSLKKVEQATPHLNGHSTSSSVVEFHKLSIMTVKHKNTQTDSSSSINGTYNSNSSGNISNNNNNNGLQCRDSDILTVFEGVTVNVEYVNGKSLEGEVVRKACEKGCTPKNSSSARSNHVHVSDHSNHRQCYRSSRKVCQSLSSPNGSNDGSGNSHNLSSLNEGSSFSDGAERGEERRNIRKENQGSHWLWAIFCLRESKGQPGSRMTFTPANPPPSSSANITATNPKTVLAKEKKAARQLGVIVGAFILCWLPYFTLFMVVAYCGEANQCVSSTVHTVTIWFGYFNSTLNPILYPLCNRNFKRAFKRMLRLSSSSGLQPAQHQNHMSYLHQK